MATLRPGTQHWALWSSLTNPHIPAPTNGAIVAQCGPHTDSPFQWPGWYLGLAWSAPHSLWLVGAPGSAGAQSSLAQAQTQHANECYSLAQPGLPAVPTVVAQQGDARSSLTRSVPSPMFCVYWQVLQPGWHGPPEVSAIISRCCRLAQPGMVDTLYAADAMAWPRPACLQTLAHTNIDEYCRLAWPSLYQT